MWFFLLRAFASAPEVCDGIDNDIDGSIDDGGVCGSDALEDPSSGHAYAVVAAGPGDERVSACDAIGYHPADPTTSAENDLLSAYADSGELWIGITRADGVDIDSQGVPLTFTAWFDPPSSDGGCSRIVDVDANGQMEWRWLNDLTCGAAVSPYLCEADCSRIVVYADNDGDGFGDPTPLTTCAPIQSGYVLDDNDCDDTSADNHPNGVEICDGIDNDCDGHIDEEAIDATPWYLDTDGDGAGDDDTAIDSCTPVSGRVSIGGDCEPGDPLIHPFAAEACVDGIDNDCDGAIDADDDDFQNGGVVFWFDGDGDGVGDPSITYTGCSGTQPVGYVSTNNGEDCDDASNQRSPLLQETCDGIDNNCDLLADNGLSFLDYWPDVDMDGFGDAQAAGTSACAPPTGLVGNQLDCDDDDPAIKPFVDEICDGSDNDCNGVADDGLAGHDYYPDLDEDGFGDAAAAPVNACAPPDDLVTDATDCDDTDDTVYPGAPEDPEDGIDSNCDGAAEHPPPGELVDSDGDSIPDVIDPTPNGYDPAPGPTPASRDYGFGCATTGSHASWLGVIRR